MAAKRWRTEDWMAVFLGFLIIVVVIVLHNTKAVDLRNAVSTFRWTTDDQIASRAPDWIATLNGIAGDAEIKAMRTAERARGRGVASALLRHLLTEARTSGYRRLFLETGSQDFFAPARRLYERHGFAPCPPFAGYELDPNSVFMTLVLNAG